MQLPPTFTKNYAAVLMFLVEENSKYFYVIELDISFEVSRNIMSSFSHMNTMIVSFKLETYVSF